MQLDSPAARGLTRIITGECPDPRLQQVLFLVPVLLLVLVTVAIEPRQILEPPFVAGLVVVAVATAAAYLYPWSRLGPRVMILVPLTDLVAIASIRLVPDIEAIATLVVCPAIWLGLVSRRRGVVIAVAASVVTLTVPGLFHYGFGLNGLTLAFLLPVIAGVTAYSASLTASVWTHHLEALEAQGAELDFLLREVTQSRLVTEAIVQTVDVGLLALGPDGEYKSMNPTQEWFLALAYPHGHGGIAGETGYAFASDRETPLARHELPSTRAASGEAFSNLTIWIGENPDLRRALSVSSRPMYDDSGTFKGAVLAYQDVTDLMAAMRVKDEFVASVSHELRTPLTSILGYIALVTDDPGELSPRASEHLAVAHRNAERLLLLVTDLLSTAQLESGTLRMQPRPVDLGMVVGQCVATAESVATQAGVRVKAEVASLRPVEADPARIAQVVDNLISNAVKYTPPGGEVVLRLGAEGDEVVLEVCDTGIGMAPDDLSRVFTKFFRARSAQERAIPGVGLGLVITKAIVEAHGGTIEVSSVEREGTTVRARLPRATA